MSDRDIKKRVTRILSARRWLIILAITSAPLLGQSGTQTDNRQYDERAISHYIDGDMAMMMGDFSTAVNYFEAALRFDSTSATIYLSLADALLNLNRLTAAHQSLERAKALDPADPKVYALFARLAVAEKDVKGAMRYLDQWAAMDSTNTEPLFIKGGLQGKNQQYSDLIDTYVAIFDRDPLQTQALAQAADIAQQLGDLSESFEILTRLYKELPGDKQILEQYAIAAMRIEKYAEAAEAYAQLEKSGRANTESRLRHAWALAEIRKLSEAGSILERLIADGHRQWDILSMAGEIATELNDYKRLDQTAAIMIEVHPDSAGGYANLAIAKAQQNDEPGAIKLLEDVIGRFPNDFGLNYILGSLYLYAERFREAEQKLIAASEQRPKRRDIKHMLASAWSGLSRYHASDSLYDELIKTDKDDSIALNNYAYSISERPNVSKSELKNALKMVKHALKLDPDNSSFLDTRGWLHYKLGKMRTARKYLQKSLDIYPENATVQEHMAEVLEAMGKPNLAKIHSDEARKIREQTEIESKKTDEN